MVNRRQPVSNCINTQLIKADEWCALSSVDLKIVEDSAICREYDVGDVVFNENDPCKGVYFVTSGLVGVRKAGLEGESTLLKIAYPNETLGYRPLLAGECHRATAEILKPGVICFINSATILPMIRHNPSLGLNFLQRASKDLGEAEERFHKTVTLTLRARFAHLLMLWKDRCGYESEAGKFILDLPVSRGDLAAMLGVRRESVSRVIHELEEEGVTHFTDRHVEVDNADHLLDEFRI
jgi:CRP-like cAMP-binding protein